MIPAIIPPKIAIFLSLSVKLFGCPSFIIFNLNLEARRGLAPLNDCSANSCVSYFTTAPFWSLAVSLLTLANRQRQMTKDQFQVYQKALILATKNPPFGFTKSDLASLRQSALRLRLEEVDFNFDDREVVGIPSNRISSRPK